MIIVKALAIAIGILTAIGITLWLGVGTFLIFKDYRKKSLDPDNVVMRVKEFRPLYYLNPDEWTVCSSQYVITRQYHQKGWHYGEIVTVAFPQRDFFRAMLFFSEVEENRENEKIRKQAKRRAEKHKLILTEAQREIDALRAKSEQELKEALETSKEVERRLNDESVQ